MPVGNVLVGDAGGNVEHDNTALAVDVVTVTETTELLLTSGIPDIELDLAEVLREGCLGQYWVVERASARATTRWYNRGPSRLTVLKPRGWTSTPSVAMYFFSNSPVK